MRARSSEPNFISRRLLLSVFALALSSSYVFAQTPSCGPLQAPIDVIQCALSTHPEFQRSQLSFEQAQDLESVARQIPNPQFQGSLATGKFLGDELLDGSAALMFPLQIGGKRGARIDKAVAEREVNASNLLKTREDIFVETANRLIRLRQLAVEIHLIEEALTTFGRIQRQYKSRPRLAPEQQVSLSVYQVAEGDYQLRRAALQTEHESIKRSLAISLGLPEFEPKPALLPAKKDNWPSLEINSSSGEFRGSAIKLAQTQLTLAQAELSLAQADSWPDLSIGPFIENEGEGALSRFTYGVAISFDLPIFQTNGGGRSFARKGLLLAEQSAVLRQKELTTEQDILRQRYSIAVKSLNEAPSHAEVERKHRGLEGHFERGVISASLVIEAHRQMVDFAKSQHEMELTAVEALYRIRALEGRLFEEKL